KLPELYEADECFLTNTSMEVMPVTKIDATVIGSDSPGPITRLIGQMFADNRIRFLEPAR
ncbi:MAG TPA: hypothetical protein VFB56_08410, partial [Nitrospiraceae bacterium]|nr:hypothetical protein [Nitrospiraceae bacterium]